MTRAESNEGRVIVESVWISRSKCSCVILSCDSSEAVAVIVAVACRPQLFLCYLTANTDLLFARVKPVEQLSPTLSTSDFETKFERKKSQPIQVGT